MKFLKHRLVRLALTLLLVAVVVYFFYDALSKNWDAAKEINISFNAWSVAAIASFVMSVVATGCMWATLLNHLTKVDGRRVDYREAVRVQIVSWLLKYVPGQAGSAVNKIVWAKQRGYGKKLVLVSFIYENIFLLVGSFVLSVPVLAFIASPEVLVGNMAYVLLLAAAVLGLVVILNKRTMFFVMNNIFSRVLKQPVGKDMFLDNLDAYKMQLYFLVPRIINGAGFVFVVGSLLTVSPVDYIPLAATYILAGAVGILAIFVPSGIGVREAVIVLFASQIMPIEQAIIVSIAARLYSTVADGVLAATYAIMKTMKRGSQV